MSKLKSPEFKLLLSCARVLPKQEDLSLRDEAFSSGINEDKFLFWVQRHLVAPLVYQNLKSEKRISTNSLLQLKKASDLNQLKVLSAQSLQIKLQSYLNNRQIKGFFLKGLPIAELYYGDIGLRHFMDIDIWVEAKYLNDLIQFLIGLGYKSEFYFSDFNEVQGSYIKLIDYHVHLRNDSVLYPSIVEVHWKLRDRLGNFKFDPVTEYEKTILLRNPNVPLRALDHYEQFIFLCTHGAEHGWFRLKWLFDLPQIIDKIDFDWTFMLKRAKELNSLEQLLLTFLVMNELIGIQMPEQVRKEISLNKFWFKLKYIRHLVTYKGSYCDSNIEQVLSFFYVLSQNSKGLFNKKLILKNLTSPNDWKLLPLPSWLFFLYFPLRPFLILWRRIFKNQC
jgi:hypothetical protein